MPGVFVDHTGPPTWCQRAWAGVLFYWPAALSDDSCLRAFAGRDWRRDGDDDPIRLAVDDQRSVNQREGYRVRRVVGLADKVQWHLGPPRLRIEEAAIDLAGRAGSELEALGVLADLCQSRRTTASRLLLTLGKRRRLPRRTWLSEVLRDIENGTCSALEHGYLTRVERAHGLPRGRRQATTLSGGGSIFRDVDYDPLPLLVELDGRLFHDSARQRDRDLERDLDAAVDGRHTVRLGWGQVFDRGCATAARVGSLLRTRGWPGHPHRCSPACPLQAANRRP
jgi:hypothetical protein